MLAFWSDARINDGKNSPMIDKNLEKLHNVELELLRAVLDIFEKYHITYYVIGGTLLGAVRHKGFIPWDDDIDFAVPRDDYRRLISVMESVSSPIVGMHYYKREPQLYYYPIRLYHKCYAIRDVREKDKESNPWIDVIPMDGMPDGAVKHKTFRYKMLYYRFLLGLHYSDRLRDIKRSLPERMIIKFAQITHIGKLVDPTKIKDKIDRLLSSNRIEDCKMAGTCMGAYFFHEFVPKEYFGRGCMLPFESLQVCGPERTHEYLTHMFGNYMELPPENERVTHFDGNIRKIDESDGN